MALLDRDADLAHAIPDRDRPRAHQVLQVPALSAGSGALSPRQIARVAPGAFALLVLEGTLCEVTRLDDGRMSELLVPGDVVLLEPSAEEQQLAPATVQRRLVALEDVELAVLDGRFLQAAGAWPGLFRVLQARIAERHRRLAALGAICQLSRAEDRVTAMLWHLADRLGTVGADGVRVPWPPTHRMLAELIGVRRSTVSLALGVLRERGTVRRREDGSWLLPTVPLSRVADKDAA